MNWQINNQNGIVVNTDEKYVYKNGQRICIPKHIRANNITTINDKVYVGGYELRKNGTWKRTLIALWHLFF